MFHDYGLSPPPYLTTRLSLEVSRPRIQEVGVGASAAAIEVALATSRTSLIRFRLGTSTITPPHTARGLYSPTGAETNGSQPRPFR